MAVDSRGRVVKVGDLVLVPCIIEEISAASNLSLRTSEPMFPTQHKDLVTLHSSQVRLALDNCAP